ncbi:MAG: PEGA domain-containing protein [Planctomycetota bacterium]|nr:PEGA domain-containing protein [Planctomycetota bacterium]
MAKPRTAFKRVIRRMRKARFIAVVLFLMVISIAGTYIVLPTGPDNTAILERLTLASVAVAEGDYERSARAITLAQEFPEDAEVSSAVSRLKDKLKEKLSGEYAAAQDLEQRALVLANIFRCMPDSELSRRTEADLLVKLEREITRLHKARGSGAKDAGSLLMELYPVLSPYTDSLDEVRSAYAARLREEADEYESQGATEAAIERLQVLALMYPSNGEYNRRISAIRAAQFSEFISKVSSITKFIGYGSLEVTGEVEGCVVTIEHLTREMGDLVMDTRISKSIALMNGLYKLQFEREGYKPIVKNVAVEADKKLEVEVTEDEWEKLEQ